MFQDDYKNEMDKIDPLTQKPVIGKDGKNRYRGKGNHNTRV